MAQHITWPDNKAFAFTIFDDTDRASLDNVPHVYALLKELGLFTTKSVWPLEGVRAPSVVGGTTCEDEAYLNFVTDLQRDGFEIALHNVTYHSSFREETRAGLTRFEELFGHTPGSMANHTDCQEGIYWGSNRLSGLNRLAYDLLTRGKKRSHFRGHLLGDPYFWGDLCQEKIRYIRNFTFSGINTLEACPFMPYYDPLRPFVNFWFASSEGGELAPYNKLLSETNQDRLEADGGACIVYTHFAKGFYQDGRLDAQFERLMRRLAKKNGWFVPVSTLLDYLREVNGDHFISEEERSRLERRWLFHKIRQIGKGA